MEEQDKFRNVLFDKVEYKTETTSFGVWKMHMSSVGSYYAEFTSHQSLAGLPLFHYTRGINPETGRRKIALGIVAVGRVAAGVVAVGQASAGVIAIGQLAIGFGFGLGQLATGWAALGQIGIGFEYGVGQLATGITAIGQLAIGKFVLCQAGVGQHIWSPEQADPEAVAHFTELYQQLRDFLIGG